SEFFIFFFDSIEIQAANPFQPHRMKFYETSHLFNSPWDAVTLACWRKYPNDKTPHVKHVEILNRRVNPTTGCLETERLIMVAQNVPSLIKRILGTSGESFALEFSTVDPQTQQMSLTTVNLTLNNLIKVIERIEYRPLLAIPGSKIPQQQQQPDLLWQGEQKEQQQLPTEFYQSVQLSAEGLISRFSSIVEEYSLNTFKNNAIIGKLGFEQVLNAIMLEKQSLPN
ncbi:Protein UPS2, mitochondrial, partial [Smittium mucronatum]